MFSKILKTMRKENDTTQVELAEKLGVNPVRYLLEVLRPVLELYPVHIQDEELVSVF